MNPRVRAFIGLGSNLDHPQDQLLTALTKIGELAETCLGTCSSLYLSEPVGPGGQPDYLNAVVEVRTRLSPLALLHELQRIEQSAGRVRTQERWSARTLDLDLLLYGAQRIETDELTVPHPRLHERAFVLYPLQEIDATVQVPDRGTVRELALSCPAMRIERISAEDL